MKVSLKTKKNIVFTLMALPGLIWFICFCYLPMFGAIIAFKDFRFFRGGFFQSLIKSKWVGFDNFKYLFSTSDAWIITRNTVAYNLVFIFLGLVLSVAVAIILNEILNKKLSKFYQSCIIFPHFLPYIVVTYFVFSFLSYDKGMVNAIMIYFGYDPIHWYSQANYWVYIIIGVNMWKDVGFGSIIYLAAIAGINKGYYEAAMIDGATKWQQTKHITIPHLAPLMILLTLLALGRIFNGNMDLFYLVPKDSGALFPTTNIIDTYVLRGLRVTGDIGMTTAAGLYQAVVGLVLILTANKIVKKIKSENAIF